MTTPRRWWLITLLIALGLYQAGVALQALRVPPELAAQVHLPLALDFVAGVLWALLFSLGAVNLIQKRPAYTVRVVSGFIVYSVVRLALFAQADYDRQRLPFLLVVFILAITAALLCRPVNGDIQYGRKPSS